MSVVVSDKPRRALANVDRCRCFSRRIMLPTAHAQHGTVMACCVGGGLEWGLGLQRLASRLRGNVSWRAEEGIAMAMEHGK